MFEIFYVVRQSCCLKKHVYISRDLSPLSRGCWHHFPPPPPTNRRRACYGDVYSVVTATAHVISRRSVARRVTVDVRGARDSNCVSRHAVTTCYSPRVDSSTIRTVSDFDETRNGRLIVGARREFQFDHSKRPGKSDARECEPDKYECVSCVIDVCFLLRRDVVTSFIACKLFRGTYMYVYGRV